MRSTVEFKVFVVAGFLAAAKAFAVPAQDLKQTYQNIIDRNPFALKPPPPPATNAANQVKVEEKPKNDIFLTGIVTVGYPRIAKRAYLMTKEQSKKDPIYYSLTEGQGKDGIEVLNIDEVAKTVRIKWEKGETLLSFQTHGITNAPAPANQPGQPGMGRPGAPPGMTPPPLTPGAPPTAHAGMNGQPGNNAYAANQSPSVGNTMETGRQIPTRPVRIRGADGGIPMVGGPGIPNAPAPAAPEVTDPAQQYLNLRLQEEIAKREGRIVPPTPPLVQ